MRKEGIFMNKTNKKKTLLATLLAFTLAFLQSTSSHQALAAPDTAPSLQDRADLTANSTIDHTYGDAIHISSIDELISFARNCTLDTWSVGKVFVLDTDIDLTGADFDTIPSFGGTFLGQNHTITGLSLSGGSNNMAFFRYIQESGQVYQLNLSGDASAQSRHSGLALLAGVNQGVIRNCHVSGTVKGDEKSAAIAGINDSTGIISNCSASGFVSGSHLVGGIAGENSGSISDCQNHCSINTLPDDNRIDIANLDIDTTLTDLLTTENAASVTDIGGITGSNAGSVRGCMNDGAVGYQHVGYNIGGIAGSQSGFLEGCVNYGVLNGRKDIGGIAGQMEPSSHLQFDEDTLKKLNEEFNTLHDLLTKLDQDCGDSSSSLTSQVDQLLNSVEDAQNAVDRILGAAGEDFSSFAEPTDLTTLPSPRPVSLDFLDSLPDVSIPPVPTPSESPSPLATPELTPLPSLTPTAQPTPVAPSGAITTLAEEGTHTETFMLEPLSAPRQIKGGFLYEPDPSEDFPPEEPFKDQTPYPVSPAPTHSATPSPTPFWPEGVPTPSGDFNWDDINPGIFDDIDREEVENSINDAQQNIYEDASGLLENIQAKIQDRAFLIGNRFDSARNMLGSSFSSIITDTRLLNSMLDDENQLVLDDFQAIIDELHIITDLITAPDPGNPNEILEDISDADQLTDTTGKVMNCINKGLIHGDLNVGGIAGSLSRENNFDPENDFDLDQYDTTLNFHYQERIVLRQCENIGKVEGKKDRIGGIAGEMLLGSIIECTNSGSVKSDGNKIGGIAGSSSTIIRLSSSKCSLSGKEKIGGIAGEGTTIRDCVSMVEIRKGDHYLGSIAGNLHSSGEATGCFFVEGCPAGIDGISYTGSAQPLPYEEFLALPGLPDIFQKIYLTFEADGRTVDTITLDYGESFPSNRLPHVPEKAGHTGQWKEFHSTRITFDQTIEAVYSEYITTLECSLKSGQRPVLLAEGLFTPADTLLVTEINAYPAQGLTNAVCYSIQLTCDNTNPCLFRMLIPNEMEKPQLEQLDENNNWISIPSDQDGSYLVFPLDSRKAVICCVDRPTTISPVMICFLVILLIALAGFCILLISRKRKPSLKERD